MRWIIGYLVILSFRAFIDIFRDVFWHFLRIVNSHSIRELFLGITIFDLHLLFDVISSFHVFPNLLELISYA